TLGYNIDHDFNDGFLPEFVEDFRRKALTYTAMESLAREAVVGGDLEISPGRLYSYKGYYLANVRRRFWAVPREVGCLVDLRRDSTPSLLHTALSVSALKELVDREPLGEDKWVEETGTPLNGIFQIDPIPPELIFEDYKGFNIVKFDGRCFAISR